MSQEDMDEYEFYEEDIREKRQLPYTISVEKIDGNIIYTHNQWGNNVVYRRLENGDYKLVKDDD
ncbi:MAG: hypothetical protein ACTSWC_06115 [Promethearchaeota archaeon]